MLLALILLSGAISGAISGAEAACLLPEVAESDHFALCWGSDRPLGAAEAAAVLGALEAARAAEVGAWGWAAPELQDGGRFPVYVGDSGDGAPESLGVAGLYRRDADGAPMIVLHPDLPSAPELLRATTAHEFFHALQDATGAFPDEPWIWEAGAVWAEHQIYPEAPWAPGWAPGFALQTHLPLGFWQDWDGTLPAMHAYGAFLLMEHLGAEAVRALWEAGAADGSLTAEAAARRALTAREDAAGSTAGMPEAPLARFYARLARWDFPEGAAYRAAVEEGAARWDRPMEAGYVPVGGLPDGWSIPPDRLPAPGGAALLRYSNPPEGELRIRLEGGAGGRIGAGGLEAALVIGEPGEARYLAIPAGGLSVALSGEEAEVWVVLADGTEAGTGGAGGTSGAAGWRVWIDHPEMEDSVPELTAEPACGCHTAGAPLRLLWLPGLLSGGLLARRRRAE